MSPTAIAVFLTERELAALNETLCVIFNDSDWFDNDHLAMAANARVLDKVQAALRELRS